MSIKPEVELILPLLLWKNMFNVKYLENSYWQSFWVYGMVLLVNQSKEDISDFKGLKDVAMANKFWPK